MAGRCPRRPPSPRAARHLPDERRVELAHGDRCPCMRGEIVASLAVRAPSGLKPAGACCSAMKLRASSPAVMSSAEARAISPTTSAFLSRAVRRPPLVRVPPSCSAGRTSSVASCHAGSRPKSAADAQATSAENARTVQSTCTLCSRGKSAGSTARRKRTPPIVSAKPHAVPGKREQQRLGQRLPHETSPSSAEREADGPLATTAGALRQQQARHVGASNQHHERAGEHQQADAVGRGPDDVGEERHRANAPDVLVGRGRALRKPREVGSRPVPR